MTLIKAYVSDANSDKRFLAYIPQEKLDNGPFIETAYFPWDSMIEFATYINSVIDGHTKLDMMPESSGDVFYTYDFAAMELWGGIEPERV